LKTKSSNFNLRIKEEIHYKKTFGDVMALQTSSINRINAVIKGTMLLWATHRMNLCSPLCKS